MLDLTAAERAYFAEMRSLTTDAKGNEILRGLTLAETKFLLAHKRAWGPSSMMRRKASPDREARKRYLDLQRKHEVARFAAIGAEIEKRNTKPTQH